MSEETFAPETESTPAAEPAKKPKKVKEPRPERVSQNGISQPGPGTKTGAVWAIADQISREQQRPALRSEVTALAEAQNLNPSMVATQYGRWRTFHGLVGSNAPGRASAPAETSGEAE